MLTITNVVVRRVNVYRLMLGREVLTDNDGLGFSWEMAQSMLKTLKRQKIAVSLEGRVQDTNGKIIVPFPD